MLTLMLFFCDWLQQSSFLLTLDVKFYFKAFYSHLKEKKGKYKNHKVHVFAYIQTFHIRP